MILITSNSLVLVENCLTNIMEFLNGLPLETFLQIKIEKRNGEKEIVLAISCVMKLKHLYHRRIVEAYDNEQRQCE